MSDFLELMESWDGYKPISTVQVNEGAAGRLVDLITNAQRLPAHRWEYQLREVITTSDFPNLFGFITDRQVLAAYRAVVPEWRQWIKAGTLPNFNTGRLHKVQGNQTRLPRVAEKGEYLVAPVAEAYYTRQVFKYGRQFDISWEATVNDILDAFSDIPQRFADAAIATEAWEATSTYCSAAGPNVALYGAPIVDVDGQAVTNVGALPLTIANLEATLGLMAAQTDAAGRPLGIRGMHLVVGTQLEITGRNILTSSMKAYTDVPLAGGVPMPTANILPTMGIQLHVDPNLEIMDLTGNNAGTWYLFADLRQGVAAQVDFLRGYESPEICMKASDKVTTGGANISPFTGDFATDNIFYRVRHVVGGAHLDPRYTYAQVST